MAKDKRAAKRRPLRYRAWFTQAEGGLAECLLTDISESGARIVVDGADAVPEKFVLVLSASGAARRACRVVWRQPTEVGVKFEEPSAARTPSAPQPQPAGANQPAEDDPATRVSLPA